MISFFFVFILSLHDQRYFEIAGSNQQGLNRAPTTHNFRLIFVSCKQKPIQHTLIFIAQSSQAITHTHSLTIHHNKTSLPIVRARARGKLENEARNGRSIGRHIVLDVGYRRSVCTLRPPHDQFAQSPEKIVTVINKKYAIYRYNWIVHMHTHSPLRRIYGDHRSALSGCVGRWMFVCVCVRVLERTTFYIFWYNRRFVGHFMQIHSLSHIHTHSLTTHTCFDNKQFKKKWRVDATRTRGHVFLR